MTGGRFCEVNHRWRSRRGIRENFPQSFDRSLTLAHISHWALIDLGQLPLPFQHLELLPTPTLMYLEYL
jgi:hypothetical protein